MYWLVELLMPSLFLVGILLLLTTIIPNDNMWARWVGYGILAVVTLAYLHWRFTETLPDLRWRLGSFWAWGFFIFEGFGQISGVITYVMIMPKSDRKPEADRYEQELRANPNPPSVDIFIATYNEDREILERTIIAATAIDYPRYHVYVLDDGKRDWLRQLCQKYGVTHVTRPDNSHAKAGNLNHGLSYSAGLTNGELIMVLDADFAPRRNFLWRTAGFFADPKIGIIQTPQCFFNPDPLQHNYRALGIMPNEQNFLFDEILVRKDGWDMATCCGTSSIARRSYLEKIGGVPVDSVTEDCLLSYRFYLEGWVTRYVNEPLSVGLAPEGLKEYLTQRSRWCLGAIQIAFLPYGPFAPNRLRWRHRWEFFSVILYWTFVIPLYLLAILAPIVFGWTGITVIETAFPDYVSHFLPMLLCQMVIVPWLSDRHYYPLLDHVQNLVLALVVLPTVAVAWFKPFGHKFAVTAKGGDRDKFFFNWPILRRLLLLFFLCVVGLLMTSNPEFRALHIGEGTRSLVLNAVWGVYNLSVIVVAMFLAIELPRPRHCWFDIHENVLAELRDKLEECRLVKLAVSGAVIRSDALVDEGDPCQLDIDEVGVVMGEVTERKGGLIYINFVDNTEQETNRLTRKLFSGPYSSEAMNPRILKPFQILGCFLLRVFGRL